MGEISPKLEKVLGMVKDEATIPVIVKLTEFGAEPINTLEGMGMKVDEQFRMTKMVSREHKGWRRAEPGRTPCSGNRALR